MSSESVCVALPVRDEASTIAAALESLAAQTLPAERIELRVYDGLSNDDTKAICERFRERRPWRSFAVESNPQRVVPHALNAALASTTAPFFTRLDGRTSFSPEYLERCIAHVRSAGRRSAAGGVLIADADGAIANAIAAAVTHPLGVSRGFRTLRSGPSAVPHHPFALWHTDFVREAGGFDIRLVRNQDDEFSMRAARHGARIEVIAGAYVSYRPRERFRGLASQYFQYGLWKAAVGRRKGMFPLRSLVPAAVTVAGCVAAKAAARGRPGLAFGYLGAYGASGAVAAQARAGAAWPLVGAAQMTMHAAYGAGLILGAAHPGLTETALGQGRVR